MTATIAPADLDGIEFLWEGRLAATNTIYLAAAAGLADDRRHAIALAATLVEGALTEQRLGGPAAAAVPLLAADLCLARASRLLANSAPVATQVAFARVVEDAAAAAAEERPQPDLRGRLLAALGTAS